jgi:hypothetical protein
MRVFHSVLVLGHIFLLGCSPELARRCAEAFPCRDSLVIQEHIVHDTVTAGPWMFVHTDTVPCPPSEEPGIVIRRDTIRIPVVRTAVEFRYIDTSKVVVDVAAQTALRERILELESLLSSAKHTASAARPYKSIAWLLILAIIAALAFIVTKTLKQ